MNPWDKCVVAGSGLGWIADQIGAGLRRAVARRLFAAAVRLISWAVRLVRGDAR